RGAEHKTTMSASDATASRRSGDWKKGSNEAEARVGRSVAVVMRLKRSTRLCGRRANACASRNARQQRHESYRIEGLFPHAVRGHLDDRQALHAALVALVLRQRQHHAPARLEVLEQ